MSKSRGLEPNESYFQLTVIDYTSKIGNIFAKDDKDGVQEKDFYARQTLIRKAKTAEQAKRKVPSRLGSIIECFKIDNDEWKLHEMEHLNLEELNGGKRLEFELEKEEIVMDKDFEVEGENISIENDKTQQNRLDK